MKGKIKYGAKANRKPLNLVDVSFSGVCFMESRSDARLLVVEEDTYSPRYIKTPISHIPCHIKAPGI